MKVICAISGLTLTVSHLPGTLRNTGWYHPIFSLPQRKLLGYYSLSARQELTPECEYLTFLALLHSTGAVDWTCPATFTPESLLIVRANIAQLLQAIELTNVITERFPSFSQPRLRFTPSIADLSTIHLYIRSWRENIESYRESYASFKQKRELGELEQKLRVTFSDRSRAALIAEWAATISSFPESTAEYWKRIIRACENDDKIFLIPRSDIATLKDYCCENIPCDSLHWHTLIELLNSGIQRQINYLGYDAGLGYTISAQDTPSEPTALVSSIIARIRLNIKQK